MALFHYLYGQDIVAIQKYIIKNGNVKPISINNNHLHFMFVAFLLEGPKFAAICQYYFRSRE